MTKPVTDGQVHYDTDYYEVMGDKVVKKGWLGRPADGLGYGIAVALVVFGVLAGLLVSG